MAPKKLKTFLMIAALLPKYLNSTGKVKTPTMIKVVIKTATTV
jgi:hypothetical protein